MTTVGAVLCGGLSSRMGQDKASLDLGGRPMGSWVATAMRDAGLARVVALGGSAELGLEVVADPPEMAGTGPLAALIAGLRSEGDILVCPCDVPTMTAEAIGSILRAAHGSDALAVLGFSDQLEPLIGLYRAEALDLLVQRRADGARGPKMALRAHEMTTVALPREVVRNVNTPDDLAAVEVILGARG